MAEQMLTALSGTNMEPDDYARYASIATHITNPATEEAKAPKAKKSKKKKTKTEPTIMDGEFVVPRPKNPPPAGTVRWLKHVADFKANNQALCAGKSGAQIVKLARETYTPKPKCEACHR